MENKIIITNVDLNGATESFFNYLDVNELTYKTYKYGIESFMNFLNKKGIKNPSRNDFKAFREELRTTNSTNTVNGYMTAVRSLFKYLEMNNIYPNITKEVKSLKTAHIPKTQVLSQEQCKEIYNSLTDPRERCLFALAITTGLRANELATSKLENIKLYNGEVVMFVKCKKRDDESEYVKIAPHVMEDIKKYIGDRTQGNIFVSTSHNNFNGGITSASVRNIIKSIFKRFGIDQDWFSCHSLRKTMATISYQNGADIVQIQQVLHHQSLTTTRRYISQCTRDNNKLEQQMSELLFG